jgi:hypothetical protein
MQNGLTQGYAVAVVCHLWHFEQNRTAFWSCALSPIMQMAISSAGSTFERDAAAVGNVTERNNQAENHPIYTSDRGTGSSHNHESDSPRANLFLTMILNTIILFCSTVRERSRRAY